MTTQKTELPTPQRLRKAREDGQVARSKDFTESVLVLAMFGFILSMGETMVRQFSEMILLPASVYGMEFNLAVNLVATRLLVLGIEMLAPFLMIVIGLGLFVELSQTKMMISFKAAAPSGKKLNVIENVKNMFGAKNLFEFLKSNVKVLLLSVVVYGVLRSALPNLLTLPYGEISGVGVATAVMLKVMMLNVALGYAVISITDLIWQQRQHIKQLMMTKDEVTKEHKESEGDPHIKNKRRELHKELLEHNEVENVKNASVVVTNPTHYAVALRYEQDVTPLPIVIAKGEGELAHRIARVARQYDIPVLQNIPLARALTATAALNEYIPADLIEPVAEVLRLVRDMKQDEEQ